MAACTETSSADVGSSQTTTRGSPANARAMATRCFRPPESWVGRASSRRSSRRTALGELAHARVAPPAAQAQELRHRAAEDPPGREAPVQRRVGILEDDLKGAHLVRASRRRGRAASAVPSSSTSVPPSGGVRPSRMRASVVLPLPDSPTSPSVSPGPTPSETSARRVHVVAVLAEGLRGPRRSRAAGVRPPGGPAALARRCSAACGSSCASCQKWQRLAAAAADAVERRLLLAADVLRRARSGRRRRSRGGRRRAREEARDRVEPAARPCATPPRGRQRRSPTVYGWRGSRKTSSAGPSSTSRPA